MSTKINGITIIPDGNTTLKELAQSAHLLNADCVSFCVSTSNPVGLVFTVAIGLGEGGKYLNQCVSDHGKEELEFDGSDYC